MLVNHDPQAIWKRMESGFFQIQWCCQNALFIYVFYCIS